MWLIIPKTRSSWTVVARFGIRRRFANSMRSRRIRGVSCRRTGYSSHPEAGDMRRRYKTDIFYYRFLWSGRKSYTSSRMASLKIRKALRFSQIVIGVAMCPQPGWSFWEFPYMVRKLILFIRIVPR
mmetsp:Transcript_103022/g.210049  ORF Transcript_103022/g.210049 Transcript_103022/m.210049 type:complete len:126 (+) Transcript_103022:2376-2753(+)